MADRKLSFGHLVCVVVVVVAAVYVYHMLCNHQGQSLMPNLGTK
jgi:hypothetical protein